MIITSDFTKLSRSFAPADLGGGLAAMETTPLDDIFQMLDPLASDLSAYKGKNRLVLLFGADRDDVAYTSARLQLEQAEDALKARDTLVLMDSNPSARGKIRQEFSYDGFGMVLIDKDGVVQRESETTIPIEDLL